MKYNILTILGAVTFLPSCVIESPEAKKMTFVSAMQNLSDGMAVLRDNAPPDGEKRLGLVPTEITATFEMTSTATGELGVNLAAGPAGPFTSAGLNAKNTQGMNRKNNVTVTFKNIFVDGDGNPRSANSDIDSGPVVPMIVLPPAG